MIGRLNRPKQGGTWVVPFLLGCAGTAGLTYWTGAPHPPETGGAMSDPGEHAAPLSVPPGAPMLTRGPSAPAPLGQPLAPEGSPNSLYPLSFPKILAGFLYFAQHEPGLSPTRAQCTRILPLIEGLGRVWNEVNRTGHTLFPWLTPAQQQFIAEKKHRLETSSGHAREHELLKQRYGTTLFPQGLGVYAPITLLCTLRASEAEEAPFTPSQATQPEVEVTPSDIAAGLIYLEEDAAHHLTPAQARGLRPLFEQLIALNALVEFYFSGISQATTAAQVAGIGRHIEAITEYKHALWKKIPDKKTTLHPPDPLIEASIALCRSTLAPGDQAAP